MKIFVTGAAGFIGSNFVHHLLDETDHTLHSVDSLTYAGSRDNLGEAIDHPRHEFVEGDIRDQSLMNDLASQVDAIVNFAAESHVDRSIDNAEPFASTNVVGTQTLLEAARTTDLEKFVQISTDEVYGQILDGTFSEDDRLNPRNPYAATKAGADHLAESYHITHDLPVVITRASNNFGPRQHEEKLIPKLITRAAAGKSLPIYGDGSNVREWIYVEDHCRAIEQVLRTGTSGEVYNIGSGIELQNLEVAEKILDAVGASHDLIEFVEDRPGHDQRYALETQKIEELGWEPQWSFDDGLQEAIEFYLDR